MCVCVILCIVNYDIYIYIMCNIIYHIHYFIYVLCTISCHIYVCVNYMIMYCVFLLYIYIYLCVCVMYDN